MADPTGVWVQIVIKGEGTPADVDITHIAPYPNNVNGLKRRVLEEFAANLAHCGAGDLKVYPSQSNFSVVGTESLDPRDAVTSYSELIVVAPRQYCEFAVALLFSYSCIQCVFRIWKLFCETMEIVCPASYCRK
jgi:hypothetical protein